MIVTPELGLNAYTCPHCGVLAQQQWGQGMVKASLVIPGTLFDDVRAAADRFSQLPTRVQAGLILGNGQIIAQPFEHVHFGRCTSCNASTIWLYGAMIFPQQNFAPPPSHDMPDAALSDYEEAARVLPYSSRAAAALLRLALEKLCGQMLGRRGPINEMIGDFVALGAPPQVRNAMDILRVTGNNAVHAGTMDNVDDQATAIALFGLLNLIVDVMITQPKHLEQMYAGLPEGARKAIEMRDQKRLSSAETKA